MPVPYCLDDCGFVVEPEVRQVDSSSSILLSQDYFSYLRFFVFPYKLQSHNLLDELEVRLSNGCHSLCSHIVVFQKSKLRMLWTLDLKGEAK